MTTYRIFEMGSHTDFLDVVVKNYSLHPIELISREDADFVAQLLVLNNNATQYTVVDSHGNRWRYNEF